MPQSPFGAVHDHLDNVTAVEFVNERGKLIALVPSRRTYDPERLYTDAERTDALMRAKILAREFLEHAERG